MNGIYKTIMEYKGKHSVWAIALLILLGVALLIVPGFFLHNEANIGSVNNLPEQLVSVNPLVEIENALAHQIGATLNEIEGAGAVVVTVSLQTGYKQEYVQNITQDVTTVQEQDNTGGIRNTNTTNQRTEVVFAKNGEKALVAAEKTPEIRGILVVAEGARDSEIKMKLSKAVQTLLGVPAHRVMVISKERR